MFQWIDLSMGKRIWESPFAGSRAYVCAWIKPPNLDSVGMLQKWTLCLKINKFLKNNLKF